jgi:DNA ligase-1
MKMSDIQLKPMLASDWDEAKIKFPCGLQPKIDGVRGLNMTGRLTGRSLKEHKNRHSTNLFSHPALAGLDGEFAAEVETHPELCTLTSSALSRIDGEPQLTWHLFDYVTPETVAYAYKDRYSHLEGRVAALKLYPDLRDFTAALRVVPLVVCHSMEELLEHENRWLDVGYEGVIIRDLGGMHKQGRSTVREGGLLRIKRFIEEEAEVIGIEEGQTNLNEKQTNELGNSFRSTHQENMVPNGQVGSLTCRMLKDVFDPQKKDKLLLAKGQIVTVSPGKMTADQRKYYFQNPHEIVNQIVKFKFFPKGGKDKPRFPTYVCIRPKSDMGGE